MCTSSQGPFFFHPSIHPSNFLLDLQLQWNWFEFRDDFLMRKISRVSDLFLAFLSFKVEKFIHFYLLTKKAFICGEQQNAAINSLKLIHSNKNCVTYKPRLWSWKSINLLALKCHKNHHHHHHIFFFSQICVHSID